MSKYWKPRSVTFWAAGMVPLLAGLAVATTPIHGLADIAQSIKNASGLTAPALINIGIAGIGLRAAIS